MSSKTFKLAISLPLLQAWIDKLWKYYSPDSNSMENNHTDTSERKGYSELVCILIAYPRNMINTRHMSRMYMTVRIADCNYEFST